MIELENRITGLKNFLSGLNSRGETKDRISGI